MPKPDSKNLSIEQVRHTLAHILATAVLEKFPKAQLGIGPAIDTGFYYDIKFPKPISEDILSSLEERMREIIAQNLELTGEKVTPQKAKNLFKNQPFKLDLIKDFVKDKKQLTVYHLGEKLKSSAKGGSASGGKAYFVDLCKRLNF